MELWEIIGIIILAGPLITTSLCLAISMIRTGIEELLDKTPETAYSMDINLKRYIEEVKEMINQ